MEHVVLQNTEAAQLIAKTPEWVENQKLHAELKVNGISIPASALEEVLQHIWEQAQVESGRAQFEELVQKEAKKRAMAILEEKAGQVLDVMGDLESKLMSIEDCIKWEWEQ